MFTKNLKPKLRYICCLSRSMCLLDIWMHVRKPSQHLWTAFSRARWRSMHALTMWITLLYICENVCRSLHKRDHIVQHECSWKWKSQETKVPSSYWIIPSRNELGWQIKGCEPLLQQTTRIHNSSKLMSCYICENNQQHLTNKCHGRGTWVINASVTLAHLLAHGLDAGTTADVQIHQADCSQHRLASVPTTTIWPAAADGLSLCEKRNTEPLCASEGVPTWIDRVCII